MKKVILLILLCAVMLTLKATGQSGDVICLEGEEEQDGEKGELSLQEGVLRV